MTYDRCPECGLSLQATAKVYLSFVSVNEDGGIVNFAAAFGDGFEDSWEKSLELADGDIDIYCENDHPFDLVKAQGYPRREVAK